MDAVAPGRGSLPGRAVRWLLGLDLLFKAVTLLLALAGWVTNHMALAQALIVAVIVIEVVVIAVGAGLAIGAFGRTESLDIRELRQLKG